MRELGVVGKQQVLTYFLTKLSPNVDAEILRIFLVVSTNEKALSRLSPDTTADPSLYRCCIALSRRPKGFEIVFRGMVQV